MWGFGAMSAEPPAQVETDAQLRLFDDIRIHRPQSASQAQPMHESLQPMLGDLADAPDMPAAYDANMVGFYEYPSQVQLYQMDDMREWNSEILDLGFSSIIQVST